MTILEKYYGKTITVFDSISDLNKEEMVEYSLVGRDVEIFTVTIHNKACGCTKQWTALFEEAFDRYLRYEFSTLPCWSHRKKTKK